MSMYHRCTSTKSILAVCIQFSVLVTKSRHKVYFNQYTGRLNIHCTNKGIFLTKITYLKRWAYLCLRLILTQVVGFRCFRWVSVCFGGFGYLAALLPRDLDLFVVPVWKSHMWLEYFTNNFERFCFYCWEVLC